MKLVLVGVGRFGAGWYKLLKEQHPSIDVVAVDHDRERAVQLLNPDDRFYTSLQAAIELEHPDAVINATPPQAHTAINHLAFDYGVPVLCEKPIAADYGEAIDVVARARREHIPFMIAENYRYFPIMQQIKRLLDDGEIGELISIDVRFARSFFSDKTYLHTLPHPLLTDVTVHHLDLVRFLTGSEGRRIFAHLFNPQGSPYPGNAAARMILELQNGVHVTYSGNLVAHEDQTGWHGDWQIEGTRGVMRVTGDLLVVRNERVQQFRELGTWNLHGALDDFLQALVEQREPAISGRDYLHTQCLVYHAERSNERRQMIEIDYSDLPDADMDKS